MNWITSWNFSKFHKRMSTWIAGLMAAAVQLLAAYAMFPERLQAMVPDFALALAGLILLIGPFLIPVATSAKQRNLPP